jgi:hypothetical protein
VAEVYWDLEWRLQQLGFHFTYDKRFYDRLLSGDADAFRAHLTADSEYQRRSARFIENHDEPRSMTAFGTRARVAAVAMATLPGLRFYHDGQFEGRRAHQPVQLGAFGREPSNEALAAFYRRLLAAVNQPIFHAGEWRLCGIDRCDDTTRHLVAWRWRLADDLRVVVVNLGTAGAQGLVDVRGDLPPGDAFTFIDAIDENRYRWLRRDLDAAGLYVRLAPGQAHLFSVAGAA